MAQVEEGYSSLQIVRPVIETQKLTRFMTIVDYAGKLIFKSQEMATVLDPEITQDDEIPSIGLRSLGVARHRIYDTEKLKLPLLDMRSPQPLYKPLYRAFGRLMEDDKPFTAKKTNRPARQAKIPLEWRKKMKRAALAHDLPNSDELFVEFDSLTQVINPGYEQKGLEFALRPTAGLPESLLLVDEAAISFEALATISKNQAYPTSITTPMLPILRLPKDAPDGQVNKFCRAIEDNLPIELKLAEPRPVFL